MAALDHYAHRGTRALVLLHERALRAFLETWREAADAGLPLAVTDDADYASLAHVRRHVLRAARGYMTWMCEKLELPDPAIEPAPEVDADETAVERFVEHLLERWREPLVGLTEERADHGTFPSRWGTDYCIDAMLEHAVMHPIRHEFQLREALDQASA